ncbi:MAG: hypothetical protein ABL929_12525 [Ferruginibacter sp.]
MRHIFFILFLINSIPAFTQNKFSYYAGLRFRITPIYLSQKQGVILSEKNILLQQDKHLSGTTLMNEFIYNFLKFKISYTIGARIDLVESKFDTYTITNARNKLIIDNIFTIYKPFFKNTKREFLVGASLGLNNNNSDYTYTKKHEESLGNFSYSHGNDSYVFQTYNLYIQKLYKNIAISLGLEFSKKHNFMEPSNFIIPCILLKYKIK